MASEDNTNSGFTAGETKIMMCLIKHLRGELNSDFGAVAAELGYKDGTVVKTRLRQITKKKINPGNSANGEKATPKKRKGAAASGDGAADESPAKKGRGRKPKGGKKEEEEEDAKQVKEEQQEEDEANAVETTE